MRRLALAAALTAGCSWFHVEAVPPDWRREQPLHCTGSTGWPWTDVLHAVVDGAIAIGNVILVGKDSLPATTLPVGLGAGVLAVLHAMAAADGWDRVGRCREARAEQADHWATYPRHRHEKRKRRPGVGAESAPDAGLPE